MQLVYFIYVNLHKMKWIGVITIKSRILYFYTLFEIKNAIHLNQ